MEAEICGDYRRERDDAFNGLKSQADICLSSLLSSPSFDPDCASDLCDRIDDFTNHFRSEDEVRMVVNDGIATEIISTLFNVIEKVSKDEIFFQQQMMKIRKLAIIAFKISGHDDQNTWQVFINKLCTTGKSSETTCEICLDILKLVRDEIFGISSGQLTRQKTEELYQSLASWFGPIHCLFICVLANSNRMELICATLATLHSFLRWIPPHYKVDVPLIALLIRLFQLPSSRNLSVQCLIEVSAINMGDTYNLQYAEMHKEFMGHLKTVLPITTNIPGAFALGSLEEKELILYLAKFFTEFYKNHIQALESTKENIGLLTVGLNYLLDISRVDDVEVYEVCIDYWSSLGLKLCDEYHSNFHGANANVIGQSNSMDPVMIGDERQKYYADRVSNIKRVTMDCIMKFGYHIASNGTLLDAVYKKTREALYYLWQIDLNDTKMQKRIIQKIGGDWTYKDLKDLRAKNAGENKYLAMVFDDLLTILKNTEGDNKVEITSQIMHFAADLRSLIKDSLGLMSLVSRKAGELTNEKVEVGSRASLLDEYLPSPGENLDNVDVDAAQETAAQDNLDEHNRSHLRAQQENDKMKERENPSVASSSLSVKEDNTNDGSTKVPGQGNGNTGHVEHDRQVDKSKTKVSTRNSRHG